MSEPDFRNRATLAAKGNRYEDMTEGRVFEHHWGRTITSGDNAAFTTSTLSFCPLYFNEPYAQALGHPRTVVNPLLVFNTVFGLSVEDLSEGGGPFLGVDQCNFLEPVYVGDTLIA
ncbi:MAG TPA: MaoC/PaaZ C-terminal domain-containing protein, partial [Pseudomonadales bacterium]|nr:MaoC/PaaZ C-terminal domain-containing protein [Pseudomonadales bacterium]